MHNNLSFIESCESLCASELKKSVEIAFSMPRGSSYNDILLQRKCLSMEFTKIYDLVLECLIDPGSRQLVRDIIREEYPLVGPSHREDIVSDLQTLGVPWVEAIKNEPTKHTLINISRIYELVNEIICSSDREILALIFLRCWGENSTAIEYENYWRLYLSKHMHSPDSHKKPISRFYFFHMTHDRLEHSWSEIRNLKCENLTTHSDKFSFFILKNISSQLRFEAIEFFMRKSYNLKADFYDQF